MRRNADQPFALADLRVLDLSRAISGPFVGRLLADLGADVIKVEPPKATSRASSASRSTESRVSISSRTRASATCASI
jgi:crotonobetainyl-CoA:carnitine CoA-transferase CaiB-like acyl-CoA transferase